MTGPICQEIGIWLEQAYGRLFTVAREHNPLHHLKEARAEYAKLQ
jgi:hypothetical protein